jgi:hypothetical protein
MKARDYGRASLSLSHEKLNEKNNFLHSKASSSLLASASPTY